MGQEDARWSWHLGEPCGGAHPASKHKGSPHSPVPGAEPEPAGELAAASSSVGPMVLPPTAVDDSMVTSFSDVGLVKATPSSRPSQPRFFLDIFSGARMPVSAACTEFWVDLFEPVDLIHGWDILDDSTFHSLLCLRESGLVGAALAAPYCCKHSMATLRRPGPKPVSIPQHLDGLPGNTVQQQLAVQESATVHDRARLLLSAVCSQPQQWPHHPREPWV